MKAVRGNGRWVAVALVALATGLIWLSAPAGQVHAAKGGSSAGPRPNIMLIISDDQRSPGTMQVMPRTRQIFGKGGTEFTHGFVTTPVCCPSRASIFSGLYAHRHGILTNHGAAGRYHQAKTLMPALQRAGYRTSIFGKFLNAWNNRHIPPGFNDGFLGYTPAHEATDSPTISPDSDAFMARKVTDYLHGRESNDGQPWFMVVAARAPHSPFVPPAAYAHAPVGPRPINPAIRGGSKGQNPALHNPGVHIFKVGPKRNPNEIRASQLRQLIGLDHAVGDIFSTLDKLDETKNTLAIYISDNGFSWGEYGIVDKFLPYRPVVSVPFYARWPGHIGQGRRDGRIAANIDLAPTIYDALNIKPKYKPDGHSLLGHQRRKLLFLEQFGHGGHGPPPWQSIRARSSMYVRYGSSGPGKRGRHPFEEYYDLRRDPWEAHNLLAGKHSPKHVNLKKLRKQVARLGRCAGASCP